MNLTYQSTRGNEQGVSASMAILKGLANDGGLFMPNIIPKFDVSLSDLVGKSYQEVAYEVMKLYLTDFTKEELMDCIEKAYDEKFDTKEIAPLVKVGDAYFLELFHGETIAFKDMALSILPYLMKTSAKKNGLQKKIIILTATSGDTGKAAMAGFCDVADTGIIVFYPKGGVSTIQELQMLTQKGENTAVVKVHGNFDDAQTGVKRIFADKELEKELDEDGIRLSSANSINIGRLVPQVVYYVYSYLKLVENGAISQGDVINVCVPTGNFGNILAAKLAKMMGLPIHKLICASNDNKVLYDFFETGTYNRNREFILTTSPSMDILISSNLERLIYLSCNEDAQKCKRLMDALNEKGSYTVDEQMRAFMQDFVGGFADEQTNAKEIKKVYDTYGYTLDTHTGVAAAVYESYRERSKDLIPTVIVSTASPYKFSGAVVEALEGDSANSKTEKTDEEAWGIIDRLHEYSKVEIPRAIEQVRHAPILHDLEVEPENMKTLVREIVRSLCK